jgi:hypothetical protein
VHDGSSWHTLSYSPGSMQVRWLRRLLIKSLSQSPDRAPLLAACLISTNLNFRALVRSKEFFCANHSVSACTNQTAATFCRCLYLQRLAGLFVSSFVAAALTFEYSTNKAGRSLRYSSSRNDRSVAKFSHPLDLFVYAMDRRPDGWVGCVVGRTAVRSQQAREKRCCKISGSELSYVLSISLRRITARLVNGSRTCSARGP